jgi:hypothetical protein
MDAPDDDFWQAYGQLTIKQDFINYLNTIPLPGKRKKYFLILWAKRHKNELDGTDIEQIYPYENRPAP